MRAIARPLVGVLESALYADDLEVAEAFYSQVLGLELDSKEAERHVFFKCGGSMLLLFSPKTTLREGPVPSHGATGPGHVAFAVASDDDLTFWKVRLEDQDVAVEADLAWPGGGRSIYFRDPAGNSLELTTPRIWGLGGASAPT
jgi:catechol 2,3-dioxygenase-like lactoylglutathione lyase family enzyme